MINSLRLGNGRFQKYRNGDRYFYEIFEALCASESSLKRGRRALAFRGFRVRIVLDVDEPLAEDTELDLARKGIEVMF